MDQKILDFIVLEKIYEGVESTVYKVRSEKDNEIYVLKIVPFSENNLKIKTISEVEYEITCHLFSEKVEGKKNIRLNNNTIMNIENISG